MRGEGCVAADLNGDGHTDLFVTTAQNDELLWNNGDGTFTEGARSRGVVSFGWHSGAAVADVNGDGRPDLYVAGYTEANGADPRLAGRLPDEPPRRARRALPERGERPERPRAVPRGRPAGGHRPGAVRPLARRRLHRRERRRPARPLRRERRGPEPPLPERAGRPARVPLRRAGRAAPASPTANAGMGIAEADYSGDGRADLFVTQLARPERTRSTAARPARLRRRAPAFVTAFGTNFTGWGDSWVDLEQRRPASTSCSRTARSRSRTWRRTRRPVQVLENRAAAASSTRGARRPDALRVNGRGLAAADFDNDGHVDVAVNSIGGRLMLLRATRRLGPLARGEAAARSRPGAVVTVTSSRRAPRSSQEVHAGSSYLSSEDPRVHFGLGQAHRRRDADGALPGRHDEPARARAGRPDRASQPPASI